MQAPVDYEQLSAALTRIGFHDEPAEYHGTLCGSLCVRQPEEMDLLRLLDSGHGDERGPLQADDDAKTALRRLCAESLNALQDDEMRFAPLLPADETALAARVLALGAWCEGFLYGLASRPGLKLEACSEDVREVIRDFTQFTQATLGEHEDLELEESAYAELVEYIRVGAQLVFMEFRPEPMPDPSESRHVH
jgi:uncharacterized protein YgfB (UPF0149 family)